jgi:uncharacterized RDD family membrane protein YckC
MTGVQYVQSTQLQTAVMYGGFWLRFVAYIIDGLILSFAQGILLIPVFLILGLIGYTEGFFEDPDRLSDATAFAMIGFWIFFGLISMAIMWLYFALFESSDKQATPGKLALGLRVTDMYGNKITFGRATGRYFGKIFSGLILNIGYIMAGFTEKKQALHDIIAGCLVVRKL